ncbi:hypothetical protein ES689_02050 [Frigoribacterium sp. ACAM 257]|uniref:carbohydrate binding domain-containing protein n=1 Tax=Frigoribacterium sp. ACAM 257 TaxID=2508998 RepID=UPI0011B9B7EA|nr:carbohydrate binding domain-containing protein [Frigoribacterium sp. ACAM 257]TWX40272.1 hypothetical protein ES689_02050 [Frigoribacterium sp. ACAM 257]
MRRHSRFIALATSVAVAAGLLTGVTSLVQEAPAQAAESAEAAVTADARNFNAGNIISDASFYNAAAMTAEGVQAFLNSRVVTCKGSNGQPCLKDYRSATPARSADAYCAALGGSSNETAASAIVRIGQACGINPQVLLVMLQKEQGLVNSTAPSASAYRIAMGYGCPDTAACDTRYYGFANQVYNAAHQFQRYTKTSSSWSYQPGRTSNILYQANNPGCGTKSVTIANQATANLYIYTPYTPNQAALNAGYGTGDSCSAYGNRNFYLYFTDWFGSPSNWLQSSSFEGGSVAGWQWSNGFINRVAVNNAGQAQSGNYFLATNTSVGSRAVTQDVRRTTNVGEQATATVWLRSGAASTFKGKVVVWGLGGTQEVAEKSFSVGQTWTQVKVALPVRASSHSTIRLDVYMETTGSDLWMDTTSLQFGRAPEQQNVMIDPSFERGSFGAWTPGNGFINRQVYNDPSLAQAGSWFAAANTPVAGRSFAQEVAVQAAPDQTWTATVWLRSTSSTPYKGTFALWGLGGSRNIVGQSDFTVGSSWQKFQVALGTSNVTPKSLKLEVYMKTANGQTLWLDNGSISKQLLASPGFEGGQTAGWSTSGRGMNFATYTKATSGVAPASGTHFAATNTTTPGTSLSQTVARQTAPGETYTAVVYVRSGTATPFSGRLALWGLGGTAEAASKSFTTTGSWTRVEVALPTKSAHSQLKFEIYEDSVNNTMFLDAGSLY